MRLAEQQGAAGGLGRHRGPERALHLRSGRGGGCRPQLLFATTARPRDLPKRVVSAAGAAREARAALAEGRRVGVLFGPERTGLSNDDLIFADAC